MWQLDYKESWVLQNWCFWTVVAEETLERPLDSKIKPVNPKGNQPSIFIGRTDAKDEAPILWPPDMYSWFIRKDPDAGTDWGQEEKGLVEGEMVGGITNSVNMNLSMLREMVKDRDAWHATVCGVAKSQTRLSDWTECFWQTPTAFHGRNTQQTGKRRELPQPVRGHLQKAHCLTSYLTVKDWMHCKIKNKARMCVLTTSIQCCTTGSSKGN